MSDTPGYGFINPNYIDSLTKELAETRAENARLRDAVEHEYKFKHIYLAEKDRLGDLCEKLEGLLEEFADKVEEIACDDAGCSVENLLAQVVQVRRLL